MRIITISAAFLVGFIASHAMADSQDNWVPRTQDQPVGNTLPLTFDSIIGGWYSQTELLYICRPHVPSIFATYPFPGFIDLAAPGEDKKCDYLGTFTDRYYDVLRPAWLHCDTVSVCGNGVPGSANYRGGHGTPNVRTRTDGPPLYFCRAIYADPYDHHSIWSMQLGRIGTDSQGCLIPDPETGQEQAYTSYDVLVNSVPNLPITTQDVPDLKHFPLDALVGGWDSDQKPLYLCQAYVGTALVPGKARSDSYGCVITWGVNKHEQTVTKYQVLIPRWQPGNLISIPTFPMTSVTFDPKMPLSSSSMCRQLHYKDDTLRILGGTSDEVSPTTNLKTRTCYIYDDMNRETRLSPDKYEILSD